ncbi:hypothetical protein IAT38_001369 [Cryptococcus sp. DSM 104549]
MFGSGITPCFRLARYLLHRWVDNVSLASSRATQRARLRSRALLRSASAASALNHQHQLSFSGNGSGSGGFDHHHEAHHAHHEGNGHEHKHPPYRHQRFPRLSPDPKWPDGPKEIYNLMNDERLFVSGAAKPPREVVVLCHGLYGFSTATPIPLFPSLKLHYWASVLEVLRDKMGVNVVVVGVKGTGSVKERAEQMHDFLRTTLPRGTGVNFVAHSMGGLDCRYLISHLRPTSYTPLSLTTIGTPHRGSPFMDWCAANIGVGSAAAFATAALSSDKLKALPYSLKSPLLSRPREDKSLKADTMSSLAAGLTSYLLSIFDSPAYSNLTTAFLRDHFNPSTPDMPGVKYTSVAGRISKMSVLHPLWFPKLVLDAAAENGYAEDNSNMTFPNGERPRYEGNDGLVSVSSAKWGEYLGAVDECHHWDLRGEGGLFPNVSSSSLRREEGKREGPKGGEGWGDGKDGHGHGMEEHLGLSKAEAARQAHSDPTNAPPSTPPPSSSSTTKPPSDSSVLSPSSWDLAQVTQVVDWVTDFLPGGQSTEAGKRQLEEAALEKRETERAQASGASERERETERGKEREREKEEKREEKRKREKFDLARFYGGLMIKLREDGF